MTTHQECIDCDALIDLHRADMSHCDCGGSWPCAKAGAEVAAFVALDADSRRERRRAPCGHFRCADGPSEKCRALPPEEITPTEEDLVFAKQLIDEGWQSISTKRQTLARWLVGAPKVEDMIKPEHLETPYGRELVRLYRLMHASLRSHDPLDLPFIETKQVTIRQFRAFKKLGGLTG